jgi:hypothetical protein
MKIQLQQAFFWQCPNCKASHCIVPEPVPTDSKEVEEAVDKLRDKMELTPWQELPAGHFVPMPTEVDCEHCGAEYECLPPGEIEPEDEPFLTT